MSPMPSGDVSALLATGIFLGGKNLFHRGSWGGRRRRRRMGRRRRAFGPVSLQAAGAEAKCTLLRPPYPTEKSRLWVVRGSKKLQNPSIFLVASVATTAQIYLVCIVQQLLVFLLWLAPPAQLVSGKNEAKWNLM